MRADCLAPSCARGRMVRTGPAERKEGGSGWEGPVRRGGLHVGRGARERFSLKTQRSHTCEKSARPRTACDGVSPKMSRSWATDPGTIEPCRAVPRFCVKPDSIHPIGRCVSAAITSCVSHRRWSEPRPVLCVAAMGSSRPACTPNACEHAAPAQE
jgi:hypothetical protein